MVVKEGSVNDMLQKMVAVVAVAVVVVAVAVAAAAAADMDKKKEGGDDDRLQQRV